MAMKYELIQGPNRAAREMILRRMPRDRANSPELANANWGAVLLVQGMVIEIMAAADIGGDAADVFISELVGNCPQHINSIAFIGTPSRVDQVLNALKNAGKI